MLFRLPTCSVECIQNWYDTHDTTTDHVLPDGTVIRYRVPMGTVKFQVDVHDACERPLDESSKVLIEKPRVWELN